ncbi:hypothetical protein OGR47_01345 [Methylocystis sp. MJC1]|jgi:hypothetical protein|uniref:surface-adhesin E family protein n=1 Tax=Methylocystis sp. MJC1 TaxID=2654282 RepID=UPI0013EAF2B1|nr:surface-adhesin E family protein [Methylocystis sp. MJC1]KAF2989629.1 hypothetical protein MJC1_03181 [Methylocystis sp. MJC1]MBU6525663.1 hypothetical protein [Methylocystis sp. MJC1]UZX12136.1 hypothetical protein OGR47_01345 [Methylocystis sp. MJC1]
MRKIALPVLLACLLHAPVASAEWLLVSQDGFSKIYLDPASRKRTPDGAIFARALTDYDPQSPEAAAFKLSEKGLSEVERVMIDCEKPAYRSEGGSWFVGHMATGARRSGYPAGSTWSKVPPYYLDLSTKLCGKE